MKTDAAFEFRPFKCRKWTLSRYSWDLKWFLFTLHVNEAACDAVTSPGLWGAPARILQSARWRHQFEAEVPAGWKWAVRGAEEAVMCKNTLKTGTLTVLLERTWRRSLWRSEPRALMSSLKASRRQRPFRWEKMVWKWASMLLVSLKCCRS